MDEIRKVTLEKLLANTEKALARDAKIVVWTEAAAAVLEKEENSLIDALQKLSGKYHQTIVASYIIPKTLPTFQYENKAIVIVDGKLIKTYLKYSFLENHY